MTPTGLVGTVTATASKTATPTKTGTGGPATATATASKTHYATRTVTADATATATFEDVTPTGVVRTVTPTHTFGVPVATATATATPNGNVCDALQGAAFGLCNAYCNAQDCPANPNHPSCDELRNNFERQTGSAVFPCDVAGTVTPTPSGGSCACDCASDGAVTIDDLTNAVLITLGQRGLDNCPRLIGRIGHPNISHLVAAVIDALNGCA